MTVTSETLHEYIFGITVANDVSARDVQLPQKQFFKGKSYRGFCPLGNLVSKPAENITELSTFCDVWPGNVLLTGTPLPAARSVLDNAALIDEADVEHASARALIAELRSAKPGDDHYDAKVKVLGEYVRHHVKEEQDELFPKLRRTALDMVVLGERMAARKHELAALFSNPAATEDAMRRFIPIV